MHSFKAVGTIGVRHDRGRKFDAEDERPLTGLASHDLSVPTMPSVCSASVFDYGAPVGLRAALAHPEHITAIISQNGIACEEATSDRSNPIQKYRKAPTQQNREAPRDFLTPEATESQYADGVRYESPVAPESYTVCSALLAPPGNDEIQLDLLLDYASKVALYPKFEEYLRGKRPPLLAVWGKSNPFFLPPGAEAFKRDAPNTDVHFYDTGHIALETHHREIAGAIRDFLERQLVSMAANA